MILALLLLVQDFGDAIQPQPAVASDGTVYVVMLRGGNVQVAVSKDKGKTFEAPVVAMDAGGRARGGMRRGPRIGVDAKGGVVVTAPLCFDKAEFEKQYPTPELWFARSTDGGKTWSKPGQVNEVPKKAAEALHWMAVAPAGDVHVAWLDCREGDNTLWYAKITGDKVSKNVKLTGPVCECCAPGMAVDGKGNPVITVRERKAKDRAVLLLVGKSGGKSFGQPVAVNEQATKIDT